VIAGDFDPAEAKRLVQKYYGDIPPGPPLDRPSEWVPTLNGERVVEVSDHVSLDRVYIAWPSPKYFAADDAALDVAARVLSDGLSSRLNKALVYDQQLATTVAAFNATAEISSMFVVQATARPGVPLGKIEPILTAEIARLAKEGPTTAELERAKTKRESEFIAGLERIGGFGGKADVLNQYNVFLGDPGKVDADINRYRALTPGDIQRAVAKWIDTPNRAIIRFHPDAATRPPAAALELVRSLRPSEEELRSRLERGDSILLESAVFDPLSEPLPQFAASSSVLGTEGSFLVQLRRDLTSSDRAVLEEAGIRFVDYVPSRAYVVRATPSGFAALRSSGLVRWLDALRGGYKTASVLRSDAWIEDVYLAFRLFPEESATELLERLRASDGAIRLSAITGDAGKGATLRVLVPAGRLHPFVERAAEDPAVLRVEPWYLPAIENDDSIWVEQSFDTTNQRNYSLSATLWSHGITGTGQTPGLSDTGIDDDMCFFRSSSSSTAVTDAQFPVLPGTGTIDLTKKVAAYYVMPNATAYDGDTLCNGIPESYHGTHTAGTVVGDNYFTLSSSSSGGHDSGDGMAPNAKVIFQDIGSETSGCLDGLLSDFHLIAKQAYDAGVRIHSNSWGSSVGGAYTSFSSEIDEISYGYEDLLFVYSAGNSGSSSNTIGSPASAKSCLTVGATEHAASSLIASYSSRGPTDDGRTKPDIVAPGSSVISASGDATHTTNNCSTKSLSGTSMAAPTAAGGATLLRQYFTDGFYPTGAKTAADALGPSAALMKAALVNGAIDVANTTKATMFNSLTPDQKQGFGRIQLDNVAFFSTPARDARRTRVWDKWNGTGLTTGQVEDYPLQVTAGQPLEVTLAWTDPEGSLLSLTQLVNNLDLEVIDPSSNVYRGNVFSGGQSVTGGSADLLNPVEDVFLKTPVGGTWTLRVKATAVPGAPSEPYSTKQGYALVATYADCTASLLAPTGLTATDQGASGVALSWATVAGATRYQIYRAAGGCGALATAYHYLGQTTSTTFTDAQVQGGLSYAYKVRAVTNCTEGPLSSCATATSTGNSDPSDFSAKVSNRLPSSPHSPVVRKWANPARACSRIREGTIRCESSCPTASSRSQPERLRPV
jgi:hypothetical protein